MFILPFLVAWVYGFPADAQNVTCTTRPPGDNSNACASTAFVTAAIGGGFPSLPLSIANGGNGTSTPGLVAGSNIMITGTWPFQTISASGGAAGSGTVASGTAGQVGWYASDGTTISGSSTVNIDTTYGGVKINPTVNSLGLGFNISQTGAGTSSSTGQILDAYNYNQIWVTKDNIDVSSGPVGVQGKSALEVEMDTYGTAATGNAAAISAVENVPAAVKSGLTNGLLNFVGIETLGQITANVGGTGLTDTTARGSIFGGGIVAIAAGNATNLLNVNALELDVQMFGNASSVRKSGLSITTVGNDSNSGSGYDSALVISCNGINSPCWSNGIDFTDYNGRQPVNSSTGILIRTQNAGAAFEGIDFKSYTFSGAAIATPGFTVTSNGTIAMSDNFADAWTVDLTSSPFPLGNGATANLAAGSGCGVLRESVNATQAIVCFTNGTPYIAFQTGSTFVVSGSPSSGKVGLTFGSSRYQIINNVGSTNNIYFFGWRQQAS